jgi:gas vesicle protein
MKNPFVKHNNNAALIALGITGAAAAGAIAYLYLTDSGHNTRDKISDNVSKEIDKLTKTFKDSFKDLAAGIISAKTPLSKKTVKAVADHVVK